MNFDSLATLFGERFLGLLILVMWSILRNEISKPRFGLHTPLSDWNKKVDFNL
jgi:hypothetical protein